MANSNFIVHNGLTVGPLTIDAATGSISTSGTVSVTGGLAVSTISKNDSSLTIDDTGTGSSIVFNIDGATEHTMTSDVTTLNGNLVVNTTAYLQVPAGTSAQRPLTAALGMVRYNSTISSFEGFGAGSAWSSLGGVKSVDGKAYITAEASAGAGDDVIRVYSGSTGTSAQVMWASGANVSILPTTTSSSTTTGALQVAGGVGIAGTVYVGGAINAAGLTTSATILASANNTLDIGAAGTTFATVYATTFSGVSTTAKYADLAENYQADKPCAPGTVVMFGGSAEVTIADANTTSVAGVVSTNPAHLMNGGLVGANVVPLALQGRVPCNVIGPVKKGDMMVSAGFGYAKASADPKVGQVIGKALSDFNGAKGQIEVVVGRV